MTLKNNTLVDFLNSIPGQQEVALVIAKNKNEASKFAQLMNKTGFKKASNVKEVFLYKKAYFTVDGELDKATYDFIVQYPTRSVQLFDGLATASETFFPNYATSAFILLIEKKDLKKIQQSTLNVLSVTGLAYQS